MSPDRSGNGDPKSSLGPADLATGTAPTLWWRRKQLVAIGFLALAVSTGACGNATVTSIASAESTVEPADIPGTQPTDTTETTAEPTRVPGTRPTDVPLPTPAPTAEVPLLVPAATPSPTAPTPAPIATSPPQTPDGIVPFSIDEEATFISYWTVTETEHRRGIYYAMRSSDLWGDVYETDESAKGIRMDMPFGMGPADGFVRIWSASDGGAGHPAPLSYWPVECLGVEPDVDGDALLDDCDPYPTDGPIADYDGDGVLNPQDNCPTIANPGQEASSAERTPGLVCDTRQGALGADFILEPTATVEEINEMRSAKGLEPIVWPVVDPVLSPAVAEWCETNVTLADADDEAFLDPAIREAFYRSVPAEYGMTTSQLNKLIELTDQLLDLIYEYSALDESVSEDEVVDLQRYDDLFERIRIVRTELMPYNAPFAFSDQSCDLHD